MADAVTLKWMERLDQRLEGINTKLDSKADKADMVELGNKFTALERRVGNDEVEQNVISRRRRAFREALKWTVGVIAVVGSGAVGAVIR